MKIETDSVEVLSGVRHGLTLGTPVTLLVRNKDHANWADVMSPDPQPDEARSAARSSGRGPATRTSPARSSIGPTTCANVLERASARETTVARGGGRPRAGAPARGRRRGAQPRAPHRRRRARAGDPVPWEDARRGSRRARCAARDADAAGAHDRGHRPGEEGGRHRGRGLRGDRARRASGPRDVRAVGPPARRPARPGADVDPGGEGGRPGRRAHRRRDAGLRASTTRSSTTTTRGLHRPTNRAGGLEGGITNGEEVRAQAVVKPIPTLVMPLRSIDLRTKEPQQASVERSDTCVAARGGRRGRSGGGPGRSPTRCSRSSAATPCRSSSTTSKATRARAGARSSPAVPRKPLTLAWRRPFVYRVLFVVNGPAMALRPIVKFGHPMLHAPSAPVARSTARSARSCDDMVETMYAAPGIGLAAPQIAVPLRVIVIDLSCGQDPKQLIKLVNPEFVEKRGRAAHDEGCLSVPGFGGSPVRPARVIVKGLDPDGKERTYTGTELLARAFCHEIDHIDGLLFVDRLTPLKRDLHEAQAPQARAHRRLGRGVSARRLPGQRRLRHPQPAGAARRGTRGGRGRHPAGQGEGTRPRRDAPRRRSRSRSSARPPASCSRGGSRSRTRRRRCARSRRTCRWSSPTGRSCRTSVIDIPPPAHGERPRRRCCPATAARRPSSGRSSTASARRASPPC